jgi:hypothetical protein
MGEVIEQYGPLGHWPIKPRHTNAGAAVSNFAVGSLAEKESVG